MSDRTVLFSPISLKAYTFNNRIVMSSPSRMRAVNNVPQPIMETYYAQRASAGLIISEPTLVSPVNTAKHNSCPGIYSYEQVEAWRKITKAVRDRGGKIFLQLWYGEGISPQDLDCQSYSCDREDPDSEPNLAENGGILEVISKLRQGAQNALAADFDGVEINAAFGYILDCFSPLVHYQTPEAARDDRDLRTNLLSDVIDSVASVWDFERVGVRICPGNIFSGDGESDPESGFYYIIDSLNYFKLAYVHLIEPSLNKSFLTIEYEHITEIFRPIYKDTLIIEGDRNPKQANIIVDRNNADLISFQNAFVANPDLPQRLKQNTPLNILDAEAIYGGAEQGYIDYPFLA